MSMISVSEQMLSDDEPLEMKVEKSKGAILGQLASSIAYARKQTIIKRR